MLIVIKASVLKQFTTSGHPIVTDADDPLLLVDDHCSDLSDGILGPHRGEEGR